MMRSSVVLLRGHRAGLFCQTAILLRKSRKSSLQRLQHQLMLKFYTLWWGLGPEQQHTFDCGHDVYLEKLDSIEGSAVTGHNAYRAPQCTVEMPEQDQFTIEHQNRINVMRGFQPIVTTAVEMMEANLKLAPGELPLSQLCVNAHYDEDKKQYRFVVRPFWWKMLPGDDGLAQNMSVYHMGAGSQELVEPTIDNLCGTGNIGERFLPATPEEAAEIEAEENYEREMRNSMMRAIADMNIIEVPPFYVISQKTWNTIMPWYKAKKAKGTMTQSESYQNWMLLVGWPDDTVTKGDRPPEWEGVDLDKSSRPPETWNVPGRDLKAPEDLTELTGEGRLPGVSNPYHEMREAAIERGDHPEMGEFQRNTGAQS